MTSTLDFLKLTDRYELKARLLPAFLAVLVLAPGAVAVLSAAQLGWLTNLLIGGGSPPHALSHLRTSPWLPVATTNGSSGLGGHTMPRRIAGSTRVTRHALSPTVAAKGDPEELDRVINDAVRTLRTFFRGKEGHSLLATHNEDYGFARNLAGLRLVWLPLSVGSVVATWLGYAIAGAGLFWGLMATAILLVCLVLLRVLPGYVRQRADRYAKSFFGMLTGVDLILRNGKIQGG